MKLAYYTILVSVCVLGAAIALAMELEDERGRDYQRQAGEAANRETQPA